jgi:hypothetical protein
MGLALMIGDLTLRPIQIRRSTGSRLLSYLLLFLISYGSSTEIFHHHGLASQKPSASQIAGSTFSDTERNNSSSKTPLERDCLVCQFQRGLSSAAIFAPLLILAPTQTQLSVSSRPIPQDSISTTASRGRAPPLTF